MKRNHNRKPKLVPFDAARYLDDGKAIAEYMSAVLEQDDPDLLLAPLGDVARARGIGASRERCRARP